MTVEATERVRRWTLPARRKRILLILVSAVGLTTLLVTLVLTRDLRSALALTCTLACIVWIPMIMFVTLDPDPGVPGPGRIFPTRAERRRMLRAVRRREVVSADEAARVRPLVEQWGRATAQSCLLGPPVLLFIAGTVLRSRVDWTMPFVLVGGTVCLVAWIWQTRDVRACRSFLDRDRSDPAA